MNILNLNLRSLSCATSLVLCLCNSMGLLAEDKAPARFATWAMPYGHHNAHGTVFSPDGRTLVMPQGINGAILREFPSGKPLKSFATRPTESVKRVAFHPNGKLLFSGHASRVILWDIETGEPIRTFRNYPIADFDISHDGSRLVVAERSGEVTVWDVNNAKVTKRIELSLAGIRGVRASRDFKHMLVLWYAKPPRWIDLQSGQIVREFNIENIPEARRFIVHGDISKDGRRALTGTIRGHAVVWDVETGEPIRKYLSPIRSRTTSMKLSRDGRTVLLGSYGENQRAALWDVESGEIKRQFDVKESPGYATFTPDESRVAITSGPHQLVIFDAATGKRLTSIHSESIAVQKVVACSAGTAIAAQFEGGTLAHFNLRTNRLVKLSNESVGIPAISRDGEVVASLTVGGPLHIWQTAESKTPQLLTNRGTSWTTISLDARGARLAVGGNDGSVVVWDTSTGERLYELPQQQGAVTHLTIASDGKRILAGYQTETVETITGKPQTRRSGIAILWNLKTGHKMQQFTHERTVTATGISDDGSRILTAGGEFAVLRNAVTGHIVKRYSTRPSVYSYQNAWLSGAGEQVFVYPYTKGQLHSVNGSSRGTYYLGQVAAPSYAGGEILWHRRRHHIIASEAKSGQVLFRMRFFFSQPHSPQTDWVAVTPDGLFDGSERVKLRAAFNLHDMSASTLTVSPDFQTNAAQRQTQLRKDNSVPGLVQRIIGGRRPSAKPLSSPDLPLKSTDN